MGGTLTPPPGFLPRSKPNPPLRGHRGADAAIIGGGLTGSAAAHFLAREGIRVILLEAHILAGGASGLGTGLIVTGLGEHFAATSHRWGTPVARDIWRWNRENHRQVARLARDIPCGYRATGGYRLARDPAEMEALRESAPLQRRLGFPLRLLEPDEVEHLGAWGFHGGAHCPTDGQVDTPALVLGLARRAEENGALLFEGSPVVRIQRHPGGFLLSTPRGRVEAPRVLVATNGFWPPLRLRVNVRPFRSQVLATALLRRPRLPAPGFSGGGSEYWRLWRGRLLLGGLGGAPAASEATPSRRVTRRVQRGLEEFRRTHFPHLRAGTTHRWAGTLGVTTDGLPLIGPAGRGLWVAGAYSGHGLGYTPLAARAVARRMLGERARVPPVFDPGRRPLGRYL